MPVSLTDRMRHAAQNLGKERSHLPLPARIRTRGARPAPCEWRRRGQLPGVNRRRRRLLETTNSEEPARAAPVISGLSRLAVPSGSAATATR